MHSCARCIHWKVHWRVGRRLESYRLVSAQPLIGQTIREFSISSVHWVVEVLCCQYWHSFYQIHNSTLLDSCRSKLVNVMSGVPQGSALGPLFFFLHTSDHFYIRENKLIGYADDSTLIAVLPSPGFRVTVAESLSHDPVKVSEWYDLGGIKFNASKTKTMMVSRSRKMHPHCAWPCYIGSDIWFQDDVWEASSLGFQNSFSTAWYLEEVLASIRW